MKQILTSADVDAQFAVELPSRDLMGVLVIAVFKDSLIEVEVEDVNVALALCALFIQSGANTCRIQQH